MSISQTVTSGSPIYSQIVENNEGSFLIFYKNSLESVALQRKCNTQIILNNGMYGYTNVFSSMHNYMSSRLRVYLRDEILG